MKNGTGKLFGRAVIALVFVASVAMPTTHAQAESVPGQGSWTTTLQGRDLDGNAANGFEAYYDSDLGITWLADAHYYAITSGTNAVKMNWDVAKEWATNLSVNGVTGWRLPNVVDTGSEGCNFAYGGTDCGYNVDPKTSELAHLFQVTLGNKSFFDTNGNLLDQQSAFLSNSGPFINILGGFYWFGSDIASKPKSAWIFDTIFGSQGIMQKTYPLPIGGRGMAWAVHDGDVVVTGVPEPEAYGLAVAGLFVVVAVRARRLRS